MHEGSGFADQKAGSGWAGGDDVPEELRKAQESCKNFWPLPPWELDAANPEARDFARDTVKCLKAKGVKDVEVSDDGIGISAGGDGNDSRSIALTGRAALDEVLARHPELVVLDVMMPKLDGLDVCRILRGESDVPVLMLTARSSEDDLVLGPDLDELTKSEASPFARLTRMTLSCLGVDHEGTKLYISTDFTSFYGEGTKTSSLTRAKQVRACLVESRQTQLKPYVAPAVLLFVTDPADGTTQPTFNVSRGNLIRVAAVTGGVLLLAILITVLVGGPGPAVAHAHRGGATPGRGPGPGAGHHQ